MLELIIQGEQGKITVETLQSALSSWLDTLHDLDKAISHDPNGSVDWILARMSLGSGIVGARPVPRNPRRNYGEQISLSNVHGFRLIETGGGASPPYLSDKGMKGANSLLRLITTGGATGVAVRYVPDDEDLTAIEEAQVSARGASNIIRLLPVHHKAIGSVEGTLEVVSLHRGGRFTVYEYRTKKAVKSFFEREKWLEEIRTALGKRVEVGGLVEYNVREEPLSIKVDRLRILGEGRLPTTRELTGSDPGFTGDMSTDEFIRTVRGG
jgi:hypothetical protein